MHQRNQVLLKSQYLIVILRLMGLTKTETYSLKELMLAKYARALSHPARIAILQLLIKKNSCICGDIVEDLPISQSTVSQHLKALKEAGLIKGEIEGTSVCYCIDEKEWKKAKNMLGDMMERFVGKSNICCQ
jgi:DNA-binding transcriptional ArsR family regulator